MVLCSSSFHLLGKDTVLKGKTDEEIGTDTKGEHDKDNHDHNDKRIEPCCYQHHYAPAGNKKTDSSQDGIPDGSSDEILGSKDPWHHRMIDIILNTHGLDKGASGTIGNNDFVLGLGIIDQIFLATEGMTREIKEDDIEFDSMDFFLEIDFQDLLAGGLVDKDTITIEDFLVFLFGYIVGIIRSKFAFLDIRKEFETDELLWKDVECQPKKKDKADNDNDNT
jgi:hypothetical protein